MYFFCILSIGTHLYRRFKLQYNKINYCPWMPFNFPIWALHTWSDQLGKEIHTLLRLLLLIYKGKKCNWNLMTKIVAFYCRASICSFLCLTYRSQSIGNEISLMSSASSPAVKSVSLNICIILISNNNMKMFNFWFVRTLTIIYMIWLRKHKVSWSLYRDVISSTTVHISVLASHSKR